jgi:phospholipase C
MRPSSSRRRFLRTAAGAAAASAFPASIRRALAIPAHSPTGTLADVEHVVILMQENRSFDHYFGTLPGVRGFGDRITIPQPGGATVWQQGSGERRIAPYYLDRHLGNALLAGGPHTWTDAHAAWDHGRLTHWPQAKGAVSMGYLERADLPFHFALAEAFTICDAYHCSLHGGTNSNRTFLWTGSNGAGPAGVALVNNDVWNHFGPVSQGLSWKTYPERLQAAGVSWKVYQNLPDNYGDNPLVAFEPYRQLHESQLDLIHAPYEAQMETVSPLLKAVGNTMPDGGFLGTLRDDIAAGRLPQVSWIVGPKAYCEHPEVSTPGQGAWYIQQVLDALTAQPEVWSKTVLIVNYDENDCFFDHMPPPGPPSRTADGGYAGKSTVDTRAEYFDVPMPPGSKEAIAPDGLPFGPGPRVPMFVVSPWSRGGWVNSQLFDHTSVLRLLERRFGVVESQISPWRRAVFGDLSSAFDFAEPERNAPRIVAPSREEADALSAQQHAIEKTPVPVPADETPTATQARLSRPSRALPYEIQVHAATDASGIALQMVNSGSSAVVLHVYDKLHLERVPRRYTVEAGKSLQDVWNTTDDGGRYDLWLAGPNGFHRAFAGKDAPAEVTAAYDRAGATLSLHLRNRGDTPLEFVAQAQAYVSGGPWRHSVAAQSTAVASWALGDSGGWYDFTVTRADGWTRRYAGRLETGKHSISDPAMGQA